MLLNILIIIKTIIISIILISNPRFVIQGSSEKDQVKQLDQFKYDQVKTLSLLGKGVFGSVYKVKYNDKLYALKREKFWKKIYINNKN